MFACEHCCFACVFNSVCVYDVIKKRECHWTWHSILAVGHSLWLSNAAQTLRMPFLLFFVPLLSFCLTPLHCNHIQMCNVQCMDNKDAAEKLDFYFKTKTTEKRSMRKRRSCKMLHRSMLKNWTNAQGKHATL